MRTYKTVRGLLANPNRWIKGCFETIGHDGQRQCCLSGAIKHVYRDDPRGRANANRRVCHAIAELFPRVRNPDSLVLFNDALTRTHRQIMAVVKAARV